MLPQSLVPMLKLFHQDDKENDESMKTVMG